MTDLAPSLTRAEADALETFLAELAATASTVTLPYFRAATSVENKAEAGSTAGFDPVTEADRACERALRGAIATFAPHAGILGEEYGRSNEGARDVWVLDPIDGTRAFIAGLPAWGVLVGLVRDGRALAGMMHQPFTGETFLGLHAEAGSRATHRHAGTATAMRTRPCPDLAAAYAVSTAPELLDARARRVTTRARHLRFGTDCYGYAMLAMGQVDIVIERGLNPYDIAGLVPVIEAAGGVVTTFDGARPEAGGDIVALGDPARQDEVLRLLGE